MLQLRSCQSVMIITLGTMIQHVVLTMQEGNHAFLLIPHLYCTSTSTFIPIICKFDVVYITCVHLTYIISTKASVGLA